MKTKYACTRIVKEVVEDDYEQGELPDTEACSMDEKTSITSDTLAGLVKAIGDYYCLDMKGVRMHERCHEAEDGVRWLAYVRTETNDCQEPTDAEEALWKAGKMRCWTCRFEFKVEKRIVSSLTAEECKAAGIAEE